MGVPRGTYIRSLPRLYAVSWFGTGWFELCLTRTGEPKPSVCVGRIDIISGRSTAYSFMLLLPGSVRHSVCAYSVRFTTGPNNQRHM